jgi:hypothetical protein
MISFASSALMPSWAKRPRLQRFGLRDLRGGRFSDPQYAGDRLIGLFQKFWPLLQPVQALEDVRQGKIGGDVADVIAADELKRFARAFVILELPLGLRHKPQRRPLKAQSQNFGR